MTTEKTDHALPTGTGTGGVNPDPAVGTNVTNTNTNTDADINQIERADTNQEGLFQKSQGAENIDEFGAHAKTDPKEIALVRKLDMHILVCTQLASPLSDSATH